MPSQILSKYSAVSAITTNLGALASGSAWQGALVDNTTNRYPRVKVATSIKLGTSPVANTLVTLWLIQDDTSSGPIRTDGAGATSAAITLKNARCIGTLSTGPSPSTGDVLAEVFQVDEPGAKWTVAILNSTGVALDATDGNHVIEFYGVTPEAQ